MTRGVKILENTSDAMFGAFEMETLSMALGLLTSLFADKEKVGFSIMQCSINGYNSRDTAVRL